jgi:hypothetical protein
MTLYNPDWTKQGNTYTLLSSDKVGIIQKIDAQYFKYSVNFIQNGDLCIDDLASTLNAAKYFVEKEMGYEFFVELEYVMEKGCRCGSCMESTGKWLVFNKDDTIDLKFDSENEAIQWINIQKAEA